MEPEANQQDILLLSPNASRPVEVIGDPVQIEQVLLNLVRNGIEATPPDGQVAVTLSVTHDKVTISVLDTGDGIDDTEIESIFDAFHSSKSYGMGLGLAICRSIIEAHRSHLTVENTMQGAQFDFDLPRSPEEESPKPASKQTLKE